MFWEGKIYLPSSGNRTTIAWFLASSLVIYLYQGCRTKMIRGKISFDTWFSLLSKLFLFPDQRLYIVKNVWIYKDISDCVETVCVLPLVPNNTVSETFFHKSGAVSVDWIFITGAPAWRWLHEYVTLDKTFCHLLFQEDVVVAAPVTAPCSFLSHSSRRNLLEI